MIRSFNSQPTDDTQNFQAGLREKYAAQWLHTIGRIEGISFLLLLLVAMPVKYIGHNPLLVHWLGPIHGGLFLLYIVATVAVARISNWRWTHVLLAFLASVVPFGPFIFEAWLRREPKPGTGSRERK